MFQFCMAHPFLLTLTTLKKFYYKYIIFVSFMKKIFILLPLFALSSCVSEYKRINDIHEGIFLGYVEDTSRKICLEVKYLEDWDEFDKANGFNVVKDSFGVSRYRLNLYELLDDDSKGQEYNFYNLVEAEESKNEEYYWYKDANMSTFKPITSRNHTTLYYDAYYLIDYHDLKGELEFSIKLYTEEKFNDLYSNS